MNIRSIYGYILLAIAGLLYLSADGRADEPAAAPRACISGEEIGWKSLGEEDFTDVNCKPETWTWQDGVVKCTGEPVGVVRSKKQYTNFEFICQWQHLKPAGNSGVFVWTSEEALKDLPPDTLPRGGIEVQVLDLEFAEAYKRQTGQQGDWFTTHGDVFAVGTAKMKPFAPTSPNGSRSFPRKELTKGVGHWNHYYIRAINGEVRLWVNGEEVSGGAECEPRTGYLCLESEGSPIEFKGLRIRDLP